MLYDVLDIFKYYRFYLIIILYKQNWNKYQYCNTPTIIQ